jgi:hypothetical protein
MVTDHRTRTRRRRSGSGRRSGRRHVPGDALRVELRRPAWRWAFLVLTALSGYQLGASIPTDVVASVSLYAWWPYLRGHRT